MQARRRGYAFDGENFVVFGFPDGRNAGKHGLTVNQNGTRAAIALVAALLGTGQAKAVAKRLEQCVVLGNAHLVFISVDLQPYNRQHTRSPIQGPSGLAKRKPTRVLHAMRGTLRADAPGGHFQPEMNRSAQPQIHVDAVVLAAGRSSRMGRSKASLEIGKRTFLEQAIHTLRDGGCRYVVAVLDGKDDWGERLADVAGAAIVLNEAPQSEQIDSLRLGIAALPEDSDAVAVLPVDFPLVKAETVRKLIASFAEAPAPVLRPTFHFKPGHPTIFSRALYDELTTSHPKHGARDIVEQHEDERRDIPVDDEGITIDIDTPEDYARHIEGA
jgi:CTP:molybdopterin cytidylyltransferase MocA